MNHPAKRRQIATERKRRAKTSSTKAGRRVTLAGIDEIPTGDLDPGAPDPVDRADTSGDDPTDPDGGGLAETARPMSPHAAKEIALAAGDLDASFHGLDSGEETPGGSDPTPGQDNVDQIGAALGVEEQDEKPLATTEKIAGRDDHRWELDPASSEDFGERQREQSVPRRREQAAPRRRARQR